MKVNKYGLKIRGLKAVSGYITPVDNGYYEVWYDTSTGDVWADYHPDHNEWSVYHDIDVICVTRCRKHLTMQEIADCISNRLAEATAS